MTSTTMFARAHAPRKIVVLDTSVLIADPDAIASFDGCDLKVSLTTIEELDGLKSRLDGVGQTAREALRAIEALRVSAGGSLVEPVKLDHGGTLAILVNGVNQTLLRQHYLNPDQAGNRIIGTALGLQVDGGHVEVVSNDAALRIKAAHVGLTAREYVPPPAYGRHLDSPGWHTYEDLDGPLVDGLFSDRSIEVASIDGSDNLSENELGAAPQE